MSTISTNFLAPIIVIIIGLLIEYAMIQPYFNKSAPSSQDSNTQEAKRKSIVQPFVSSLPFMLVAVVSFWSGTQYSKVNLFGPNITITSPRSGSLVAQRVDITGTAQNVTQGRELWAYVRVPLTNAYFLSPITTVDEDWSVNNITVGTEQETGNQFVS
jgi:hypothetical protein